MNDAPRRKIIKNAAQCLSCNDIIESKHRHDFVTCRCEKLSVDGGHDYLRRVGDFENSLDLSEYEGEQK
jgi:hypothetical protein